jgi:Outer membrane efflux protein
MKRATRQSQAKEVDAQNARRCIQGLRFVLMCLGVAFVLLGGDTPSQAQERADIKSQAKPVSEPARLRDQLAQASREYKGSLGELLSLYEADAKRNEERLSKIRELFAQGLITRGDMKTAEDDAARAREKIAEAQAQLKGADAQLAEALVETEAEESAPKARVTPAPRIVGGLIHTTAYIRYGGGRAWSLSEAGAIKQFFLMRFGRALPIHVFGQSPLHDRWGLDHHNAMDIGLNPDSSEGQALVEYLRANGIPFTAFHFAIPGVATGPHIHVGLPSHRITAIVASK